MGPQFESIFQQRPQHGPGHPRKRRIAFSLGRNVIRIGESLESRLAPATRRLPCSAKVALLLGRLEGRFNGRQRQQQGKRSIQQG